jgi:hypothetical protein
MTTGGLSRRISLRHSASRLGSCETRSCCAASAAAEKLPLESEELTILDEKFDPANGRLFLVDMNGASPTIVQQRFDLPAPLPRDPLDDEHILKLADKTLAELVKNHKEVQVFVDGKN